jgi:hypothetical protein
MKKRKIQNIHIVCLFYQAISHNQRNKQTFIYRQNVWFLTGHPVKPCIATLCRIIDKNIYSAHLSGRLKLLDQIRSRRMLAILTRSIGRALKFNPSTCLQVSSAFFRTTTIISGEEKYIIKSKYPDVPLSSLPFSD